MLKFTESVKSCECNSGIIFDSVAKKILCTECGRLISDDSSDHLSTRNPQILGSKPAHVDPQNIRSLPQPNIFSMFYRFYIPDRIVNKADAIFKKMADTIKTGKKIDQDNALYAACIYTACRLQDDITRFIPEICSVNAGFTYPDISKAIELIAKEMKLPWLMNIETVGYIKGFSSVLEMDEVAVIASLEAVKSSECVNSARSAESVAAMVVYVISQFTDKKKSLHDIAKVTGVDIDMIRETYKDLNTHLMDISQECFAYAIKARRDFS